MKRIKQIFLAALLLLTSAAAWAYDFEVDGIYYNITSSWPLYEVTVTYKGGGYSYSGNVMIPQSVSYDWTTYSVTSIGQYAFRGCTGLTSVTIPNSVTSIERFAFAGCTGLISVTIGNSVTSIGMSAFSSCTGLTSVTIPNSVTHIEESAFRDCTGLTSVTIPNSVTHIEESAFRDCTGLTSVTIPNSVTSIDRFAFAGCKGLISVTIGNSVTSIGRSAFSSCTGLTSVTIPNSVTHIEESAFRDCTGLTSVIIPNSVTHIEESAFRDCTGLTSVIIPNSVTYIGGAAFYWCTGLTSVTIGNSVTSIGGSAFRGCKGLSSIVVASGNAKYDSRDNCNAIIETEPNTLIAGCKNTIIPNSVTSIGQYAFLGCTGLTSVTIPNSVTGIGYDAFYGCLGLTSVIVGNSVTSIGDDAFNGCMVLTSVTIGNSVTSIGDRAFYGCPGLASITVMATTPASVGSFSFQSYDIPLFVPCGFGDVYRNHATWRQFITIVESDFTYEINVFSENEDFGVAYITQQPNCTSGNTTVKAEPKNGSAFRHWTINGQVVSTANPFTFIVSHDVEIVAHFSGTGVGEEAERMVVVAPNPARNRVRIECEGMRQLEFCTMEGRSVATHGHLEDVHELDLSGLAKGIYILRIHLENGLVVTKKLVKE